jgi:hypothetical protein
MFELIIVVFSAAPCIKVTVTKASSVATKLGVGFVYTHWNLYRYLKGNEHIDPFKTGFRVIQVVIFN